jgi:hypothetical protein
MGIARDSFGLLAHLNDSFPFTDKSVLTLGRQSGILTFRQMNTIIRRNGLRSSYPEKEVEGFDSYQDHPSDIQIFSALGFGKLVSMDSSPYEDADIIHDLNLPLVDKNFGCFDLVFDGGTSEHIFDQFQVLENLFYLCKVGGLIVHYTPANNFLDHGYFQPSPSFYQEYYEANNFKILEAFLVESTPDWYRRRAVLPYKSLGYEFVSYGGHWSRRMLGNWFVVQKKNESTCRRIPQQLRSSVNYVTSHSPTEFTGILGLLQSFLKRNPRLRIAALRIVKVFVRLKWLTSNGIKRRPKPIFYV